MNKKKLFLKKATIIILLCDANLIIVDDRSGEVGVRDKHKRNRGCLIKNSMISRHNYRKFSKKYGFSEFLMRTEPWGELI